MKNISCFGFQGTLFLGHPVSFMDFSLFGGVFFIGGFLDFQKSIGAVGWSQAASYNIFRYHRMSPNITEFVTHTQPATYKEDRGVPNKENAVFTPAM